MKIIKPSPDILVTSAYVILSTYIYSFVLEGYLCLCTYEEVVTHAEVRLFSDEPDWGLTYVPVSTPHPV